MRIAGVQVGRGFGKQPIRGRVRVGSENLEGDQQLDLRHHGGPDRAVLAYSADHYALWRVELDWPDMRLGAFAENLSVEGVDEDAACVGDVWRAGTAVLQITMPRFPCSKIPRFWKRPDLLKRVVETGRSGWYMRVLQEGELAAGDEVLLLERGSVSVRSASES
jgi:MOSC domain-containing protein YiiM